MKIAYNYTLIIVTITYLPSLIRLMLPTIIIVSLPHILLVFTRLALGRSPSALYFLHTLTLLSLTAFRGVFCRFLGRGFARFRLCAFLFPVVVAVVLLLPHLLHCLDYCWLRWSIRRLVVLVRRHLLVAPGVFSSATGPCA